MLGDHRVIWLQPEHELQNADELVTLLLRHPQGMLTGQIKDAYKGILDDVKAGPLCFVACMSAAAWCCDCCVYHQDGSCWDIGVIVLPPCNLPLLHACCPSTACCMLLCL